MNQKLERFIRDNREKLDGLEVPGTLWETIERRMVFNVTGARRFNRSLIFRVAASLVIVLCTGFAVFLYSEHKSAEDPAIAAVNSADAQIAFRYASLIAEKRNELNRYKTQDPVLYKDFSSDLTRLDQNLNELKRALPETANPEVLIQAIIKNLAIQTDLLTKQLEIIHKLKNEDRGSESSFKTNNYDSVRI